MSTTARSARPARPIPLRRRLLFVAILVGPLLILQEAAFRLAFPMPEVTGFHRGSYARSHEVPDRPGRSYRKEVRNVVYRVESGPDGFTFDHTLNLYGFRGTDFPVAPPRDRPR